MNRLRSGDLIENPRSGERIVLRQTAAETGGTLLTFDLFLAPGGRVPSGHVHPEQEETFRVIEGRMRFRVGGRAILAGAGQTVRVAPGRRHSFANVGPGSARLLVEVRPALNMEELLQAAATLGGEATGGAGVPRPLDLALFLREFEREVRVPLVPRALVTALTRPLACMASALGLDARYRRARDGGQAGRPAP
ncbi:MAG: cupin domain-containing protein [Candidatus Dormibacteraeota bacterium]|nr:cupin domain-containing protein [Candidatus Dormibacteraeota bacterium]